MVKKVFLFLILIIVIGLIVLVGIQYAHYKLNKDPDKTFLTPRIKDIHVTIRQITEDSINANVQVQIFNPLLFGLKIDSITYQVMMDSVELVHDRYGKSITVSGNDTGGIELPVTLFLKRMTKMGADRERKGIDSASYEVTAIIYSGIPFFKKINIHVKKVLPIFFLPEIKAQQLELDDVKASGADMNLHLMVRNKNVFPVDLKDYHYHLEIGNHLITDGKLPNDLHISPKGQTEVIVPLKFSYKELGGSAWEYVKKGKDETYQLRLSFKLKANKPPLSNTSINLNSNGSLRSLLKVADAKKG